MLNWFHVTSHIPTDLEIHDLYEWVTSMTEFLERIKSKGMVINGNLREIELTVMRPKNSNPPIALSDNLEAFGIPVICSISVLVKLVAILRAAG